MKHLATPRLALALALSGAVIPLSIVGCGGGNGLIRGGQPTPTPTPTSTTPAPPASVPRALAAQYDFTFSTSGGNESTLSQTRVGGRGGGFPGQLTTVAGGTQVADIQIPNANGANLRFKFASSANTSSPGSFTKNQNIDITSDTNLYDLQVIQLREGFVSSWRAVSGRITITDERPDALSFSFQNLRFVPNPETLRAGEFLASGIISTTGLITGAPTPFRDAIPFGKLSKFVPNFTLSAPAGTAPDLSPVTNFEAARATQFSLKNVKEPTESQLIESFALTNYAGAAPTALRPRREFRINLNSNVGATKQPFGDNQIIALSASDPTRQLSMTQVSASGATKPYVSQSGTATVKLNGADALTLTFADVQMRASDGSGFRLDGTLTGTDVQVIILTQPPIVVTDENGNPVPIF